MELDSGFALTARPGMTAWGSVLKVKETLRSRRFQVELSKPEA
jgi:hypothetical protein